MQYTCNSLNICQKLRFAVFCALQLPVSNLLTPEWHIAVSDKMKNMGYYPYGADYYVIRADAPIIGAGAYVDADAVDSSAVSALWGLCTRSAGQGPSEGYGVLTPSTRRQCPKDSTPLSL